MKIDAINAVFPSRVVTNEDIVSMIQWHSYRNFQGSLDETLAKVSHLLTLSGSQTRRWLAPGERPIEFIKEVVETTLQEAEVRASDVDLLIYVGVGKGFLEPGQSYMVAHALGMEKVECFDILDACMSWTRAMQISEAFFRSGQYRRILVVNGEFNLREGGPGYPANFRLTHMDELEWTFPTYTIGEAATATLLSASDDTPWTWSFSSAPMLADLCTIPGPGFELYCDQNTKIGRNGVLNFTSFGADLHRSASAPVQKALASVIERSGPVARIFPHASSKKAWEKWGETMGLADKVYHVYTDYGNLVSASVPSGIALAKKERQIQRGDRLAGWVGSAGMSYAAYSFVY